MPPALNYLVILTGTFCVSHLLFTLLEKAERIPEWLNPLRGALILTFIVQLYLLLRWSQTATPVSP